MPPRRVYFESSGSSLVGIAVRIPRSGAASGGDRLQRLRGLAWFLDRSIPIGGGRRIGLDPIIGLIPGVGDFVGALLSGYIVLEAARADIPTSTLVRMLANVGIDTLVGAIPALGDVFDAAWKANIRNVRLLEAWMERPHQVERSSRWLVFGLIGALVLFVLGCGALTWLLLFKAKEAI
jgi:hypothetical protein